MNEDSIIEKINYKVTPQVFQECVIEFDQSCIDVFSSIVVYNDSKSQENILFGLTSIQKYNNKHYPINKFDFFSLSELISKIIFPGLTKATQ